MQTVSALVQAVRSLPDVRPESIGFLAIPEAAAQR